jgi:hypothetical protein
MKYICVIEQLGVTDFGVIVYAYSSFPLFFIYKNPCYFYHHHHHSWVLAG